MMAGRPCSSAVARLLLVAASVERVYLAQLHRARAPEIDPDFEELVEVTKSTARLTRLSAGGQELRAVERDGAEYVSTSIAARVLGVTDRTVRRWATEGRLDAKTNNRGDWQVRLTALAKGA